MINRIKELLFQNLNPRQTIAKNVFWLSLSQIGSRLIRAVIIIYAARVLGAAEYGIFSYVVGLAGFFTIFADLGINPLMTREIASHPEKRVIYFANALRIKVVLLSLAAALVVLVAPKFSNIEEAIALLPFVALLVIFDNLRDFIFAYFRGIEKMELEALLVVIMNATIALFGFIVLNFSKTAGALLFAYIASVVILSLVAFYLIKDLIKGIFKNFDKGILKQILHDCWPMAFTGLFGVFMFNIDIIMLGWWRSAEEIGYYSASQRIIQILYTFPAILASAVFPAMARFIKQKEIEKEKILNEKTMTAIYFIAVPLIIGGIILSPMIIEFIFGKEYLPATTSFRILMLTLLINFPGAVLNNLVIARNRQKQMVHFVALGSASNVFLNILLIPPFGINGSAIATLIAQFLYYGPIWFEIKKIDNFYTLRYLKKIVLGAIMMGVFSFVFSQFNFNVLANILLSAAIYFAILYLLKENIVNEIKSSFNKILRHRKT